MQPTFDTLKKTTESGKSYWNSTGAYQGELDALWEKLVPGQGEANTVHGEMIRCASRLLYEFCNNGNCNAVDVPTSWEECDNCDGSGYEDEEDCSHCCGTGSDDEGEECDHCDDGKLEAEECNWCCGAGGEDEEGDPEITEYYQHMLNYLDTHMEDSRSVSVLEDFMLDKEKGYSNYTFDQDEMEVYNNLIDQVVFEVLTTENVFRKFAD